MPQVQPAPITMHPGAYYNEASLLTNQQSQVSQPPTNLADFIENSRFYYAQIQDNNFKPPQQTQSNENPGTQSDNEADYDTDEEYEESTRLNTTNMKFETVKVPTAKQAQKDIEQSFIAATNFVKQKEEISKNSTQPENSIPSVHTANNTTE